MLMVRIGALASAAVVAAAALVTANAQAPVPAQAPAAARVVVHLDVRAEDASGHLVRDLSVNDFRVFENGKRQTLSSVSLVDLPIGQAIDQPLRDVASNVNGNGGRNYILYMRDSTHYEVRFPGESAAFGTLAREFVEKHLRPGDRAGLAVVPPTSNLVRSLTDNHKALLEAIDRIPSGPHVINNDYAFFDALAKLADYAGDAPGGRSAIVLFTTHLGRSHIAAARPSRDLFAVPEDEWPQSFLSTTRFTPGIPTPSVDRMIHIQELMRAAASANVVFYVVDPVLNRFEPSNSEWVARQMRRGVTTFPEWTGGFAITDENDLSKQFDRIVEDVSAYYFIDYVSSDQRTDGKYRDLRVEVSRPGVEVRTRLGYVAPKKK